MGFTHMCKADSTFENQLMGSTNPQKQTKEKKSHDGTNRCKKAFDKTQHQFMIKTPSELGTERNHLNLIKNIYKKFMANIVVRNSKLSQ